MADERFSNDPYRPTLRGDDLRNPGRLELQHNELQPDPGLAGGPARIAIYAVATPGARSGVLRFRQVVIHPLG